MLNRLLIKNYALIDSLDMQFGEGLNLLTGETGAGKSIIMGALSLILGQRAENRFLFDESRKCVIEGYFDVSRYELGSFFEEQELDYEDETIIRREFSADGKSRAFVNDTPVKLSSLKALSERLIDVHSQHATLQVASPAFQLLVLDSVGGSQQVRREYAMTLASYKKMRSHLEALMEEAERQAADLDYKQYLYDELEAANLERGEAEHLEAEREKLEHAEDIQRGVLEAIHLLEEREGNSVQLLQEATAALDRAARFMPELEELAGRLRSSLIEVKDLARELQGSAEDVQVDEGRLQVVLDRLGQLYGLQQKHRLDQADGLLDRKENLAEELGAVVQHQDQIEVLKKERAQLESTLRNQADTLRKARLEAIPQVEAAVLSTLAQVGMPDARLHIQLEALGPLEFKADGNDAVVFQFSSNKGQDLQPVGKVASGGELSRVMLAIKTLVAEHSALPTIIFDEIDTGISGEVALRVGDVLARLGTSMQVIVITHLPQIASHEATHYRVFKSVDASRTTTQIEKLDTGERVLELAQMLSGSDPGEEALSHAAALLQRAGPKSDKKS